jgi:CBS domain-containing protein
VDSGSSTITAGAATGIGLLNVHNAFGSPDRRTAMPQWLVRDVMTTDVITVRDDEPVARIAAVLSERQISAVPVVDRFDTVTGVVSWTDLRDTVETGEPGRETPRRGWVPRFARLRWPRTEAVNVMSAPPVTITPEATLAAAGRLMRRRKVGRLLVVDGRSRLTGIVTRSDLFKVHDRLDAVIRDEVTQRILHRALMVPTGAVQASVDDGVVTLSGRTRRRTTALAAGAMTATVPGVTGVVDQIAYDTDDTAPAPAPRPPAPAPHGDWWQQAASLPVNGPHRTWRPGWDHNVTTGADSGGSTARRHPDSESSSGPSSRRRR